MCGGLDSVLSPFLGEEHWLSDPPTKWILRYLRPLYYGKTPSNPVLLPGCAAPKSFQVVPPLNLKVASRLYIIQRFVSTEYQQIHILLSWEEPAIAGGGAKRWCGKVAEAPYVLSTSLYSGGGTEAKYDFLEG